MQRIHHIFIPHASNNHRAKILHPSVLMLFITILILIHAVFRLVGVFKPGVLGTTTSISVDRLVELVNQKRTAAGVKPVKVNDQLTQAAYKKAEDMFAKNYWAHTSPTGREPWAFISDAGYTYRYAGENLAKDFDSADAVVDAWMKSTSHRDNLLQPNYNDMGIAVVQGTLNGYATVLVVQMFGTQPVTIASKPKVEINASPVKLENELVLEKGKEQSNVPVVNTEKKEQSGIAYVPNGGAPTTFISQTKGVSTSFPPAINVFGFTKSITLMLALVLIGILAIDAWVVYERGISRATGKNWAHMMYLLMLVGAIWLTSQGAIL